MNEFTITPFRGLHLLLLLLTAAAVLLACVPLGIASDAASFPDFQTAGFSSFRPQSRLAVLRGFSLLALSWVVTPFCSWAKEKSSRFLCENNCSQLVYSVIE